VLWIKDWGRTFGFGLAVALREVGRREAAMADRRALGGAMPEKTWTGMRRGRTMSSGLWDVSFCNLCLAVEFLS